MFYYKDSEYPHLECLLHPKKWREEHVHDAIEAYWKILFPGYELLRGRQFHHVNMPRTWCPDIVGTHEKQGVLIIEVKGSPPANTKQQTINQVTSYGRELHKHYPAAPVDLAIIGPWRKHLHTVEAQGYDVTFFSIAEIARDLIGQAERYLLWLSESPSEYLRPGNGGWYDKWLWEETGNTTRDSHEENDEIEGE